MLLWVTEVGKIILKKKRPLLLARSVCRQFQTPMFNAPVLLKKNRWNIHRRCFRTAHVTVYIVGFDHGLPCRVENSPRDSVDKNWGRGFCRYWGPRAMFFTRHGRPWSNPIIARSLIDFVFHFDHRNLNFSALKWTICGPHRGCFGNHSFFGLVV